jgi:hypothetical protein
VRVATAFSLQTGSELAVQQVIDDIRQKLGAAPHLLLVYFTEQHDGAVLLACLRAAFPGCQITGCSSCQGIMTEAGYHSQDGVALACWALRDDQGAYGCALAPLSDDIDGTVKILLDQAMRRCERPGELPQLVWLHASPGAEERIMTAIEARLGGSVAIVGGSAAHNLQGQGCQLLTQDGCMQQGIAITLFYPSCQVATTFHSTYMPAGPRGRVTRVEGRELLEIDHRPAAEVYNEWTQGCITDAIPGGSVFAQTTLFPLARQGGQLSGLPYYKLSHPEVVTLRRGLRLFTDIHEEETVILMQGNRSGLLDRAVRSSHFAFGPAGMDQIAALNIFCAGCMLTLSSAMEQVVDSLSLAREGVPFIGPYTFGEQGRFSGGENAHGNLMISTVVFYRTKDVA